MKNMLLDLYLTFLKIGSLTVGGGYAMLPMMQSELVSFVGYKQRGIIGGIVATLGIITPSIVVITVLAGLISSINEYPLVQKAMKGINVAVCALITDATLNFIRKTSKGLFSFIILAVSFILIYFFKVPSYAIVLGAAMTGILIYLIQKRRVK